MPYLIARPLVGQPGEIKLWVGIFGVTHAPVLTFSIGDLPAQPSAVDGLFAIRDGAVPANYQGVYCFSARGPGEEHKVLIEAGSEISPYTLRLRSLPASLPATLSGSFKILLMSCYCAKTDAVNVGRFIENLPVTPDMSVFAGDQVYLDQPPFEIMPITSAGLRQRISSKYQDNWASERTGKSGLQLALTIAPAICIPDDHEFWNNYPWVQPWMKGTWPNPTTTGRVNPWADAAQELFEDYQLGGSPGQQPWLRLDIEPLCMLFLDTRSRREADFQSPTGLMTAQAEQELRNWEATLIDHQASGTPRIAVLATGQTLLCEPAEHPELVDAELANYKQFTVFVEVLNNLAEHGIQVVFLTGDVHWSRVAQATHTRTQKTTLSEVICSPSSLCITPLVDSARELKDALNGLFAKRSPWPRHSAPEPPPRFFGTNKQFRTLFSKENSWCGNQVAIVEFRRYGSGVDMTVTYHPITSHVSPPSMSQSFKLLNS